MSVLKAAVIGQSLGHSISPDVHKRLFDVVRARCDTPFESLDYSKIELESESEFRSFIAITQREQYVGLNITFPYKVLASEIEGLRSKDVERIRSANTVLCGNPSRIISTDGAGFRASIKKQIPDLFYPDYALTILGAGGAARAVLDALYRCGWNTINIAARSPKESDRIAITFPITRWIPIEDVQRKMLSGVTTKHFIVQATPVGQRTRKSLLSDFEWQKGDIAADLVYNPLRTRFLQYAEDGNATTVDGLGMLIEQAAFSQYFWMTGTEATESLLSLESFHSVRASLAPLLTPRWDAFAI
jgi:shikimate dehydrogenase